MVSDDQLDWVPSDIDLTRPNAARIYDYVLGGANNFAVDRDFAKRLLVTMPDAQVQAQQNRNFLRRAVSFLVGRGVRQFLDLGSGIPTVGNTHEVAQRLDPEVRVLYVDNEPVAVAHSELILADNPRADVLRADVADPAGVVGHPRATALLDFSRPIGVLMFAIVHFMPDEADPAGLVAGYRDATVPGSYLAMTHGTADHRPELRPVAEAYQQTANPVTLRSRAAVLALFDGYELVPPGLVFGPAWRPEVPAGDVPGEERDSTIYGAVGRKA
ncbi:MAG TPA: SAM-dependent methyltransferase [Pseudonocardiaceae bacterium]|nr:SAM-dependent methyltransferase [Pseudonocardiaceae bacterium]